MITRLPNWQEKLDNFLTVNSSRPFEWGEWDCGSFAAKAIQVITDIDMEVGYRGLHADYRSAKLLSVETIVLNAAIKYDLPEVIPGLAGRGDLVLLSNVPSSPCLGIINLRGEPMKVTDQGLVSVGREFILRAWRVG